MPFPLKNNPNEFAELLETILLYSLSFDVWIVFTSRKVTLGISAPALTDFSLKSQ